MKLSVSLSQDDVRFIDGYGRAAGESSRSAVIQRAVRLLRAADLGSAYTQAWQEWEPEDANLWNSTAADGLKRAPSRTKGRRSAK
jgi:Arc/MetJ-type ribon-helix-helix transcriptional regulator